MATKTANINTHWQPSALGTKWCKLRILITESRHLSSTMDRHQEANRSETCCWILSPICSIIAPQSLTCRRTFWKLSPSLKRSKQCPHKHLKPQSSKTNQHAQRSSETITRGLLLFLTKHSTHQWWWKCQKVRSISSNHRSQPILIRSKWAAPKSSRTAKIKRANCCSSQQLNSNIHSNRGSLFSATPNNNNNLKFQMTAQKLCP